MEAEIVLDYDSTQAAKAIAEAVSPDNFKTPKGLIVKTTCTSRKITTRIACDCKLATFMATIDDLLSCVSTAEKMIFTARKIERRKRPPSPL